MLTISKVTKNFPASRALQNVSFEIKEGEVFSLIGPNGSGKTTLVKLACGLLRPTKGSITVGDHDIRKEPGEAKKLIGYIPDEPVIWPGMTGEEFLHFSGALYGMDELARTRKIPELLSIFNLNDIAKGIFDECSRGNKQKMTILAALLHSPGLLIIDEPIVGLDPTSATIAKQEFLKFARSGGAVLLVTHTLSVAEEIADRIGILQKGRLMKAGTLEELRTSAGLPLEAGLEEIYMALTKQKK